MEAELEFHVGRLIDHVHIRVADREASKRFYSAVAEVLGLEIREGPWF
jgi:catechol 2,3-dioxygenase-like lactoylglutathione lyase family enzyme